MKTSMLRERERERERKRVDIITFDSRSVIIASIHVEYSLVHDGLFQEPFLNDDNTKLKTKTRE